jgi:Flp pilus assembly protein TadG
VLNRSRQDGRSQSRCGAAAAELAIFLPFLGLAFAVSLDFCRVYYVTQTIENCAAAAAAYASEAASDPSQASDADAAAQAAVAEGVSLSPPLQAGNVTVQYQSGQAVVTVQYTFTMLTPVLSASGQVTVTRAITVPMAPKLPGQ